jgi:hypothetical protein
LDSCQRFKSSISANKRLEIVGYMRMQLLFLKTLGHSGLCGHTHCPHTQTHTLVRQAHEFAHILPWADRADDRSLQLCGLAGVAAVAGGIIMWVLLHFTRLMIMKKASDRPIGYVGSAVMLNAKLAQPSGPCGGHDPLPGPAPVRRRPEPRDHRWTDGTQSHVTCEFGRRPSHEMGAAASRAQGRTEPDCCASNSLDIGADLPLKWQLQETSAAADPAAAPAEHTTHRGWFYEPCCSLHGRPRRQDLDGWPAGGLARRQDPRADPHAALRLRRLRRRARLQDRKGTAIFRLREHTERLFNSAKILRMKLPFSQEQVNEAQKAVVSANGWRAATCAR